MSLSDEEIISYRLQRARQALEEAQILHDKSYELAAVNRLYYGCFYAASAWLQKVGKQYNSHKGVRIAVNQHLIKTSRL